MDTPGAGPSRQSSSAPAANNKLDPNVKPGTVLLTSDLLVRPDTFCYICQESMLTWDGMPPAKTIVLFPTSKTLQRRRFGTYFHTFWTQDA